MCNSVELLKGLRALPMTAGLRDGTLEIDVSPPSELKDEGLTDAISAAMVELYAVFYEHDRTTATTYINDNIVVCVLENILTTGEDTLIADGDGGEVIDGRVAFQTDTQDEFTAAIERLTHRRVTAFLSANQTAPGVACELFFLDAAPLTSHMRIHA
jgi:uncharacterized protein YbcI